MITTFVRLFSPENPRTLSEQLPTSDEGIHAPQPLMGTAQSPSEPLVLYVPEVEEIRISPIVARKGYLNVLEHNSNGWKKRWVVSSLLTFSVSHSKIEQEHNFIVNVY